MTNEEKAKEIAEFHQCPYRVHSNGGSKIEFSITECYDSAMEMGRWKDKENIEHSDIDFIKVCNFLLTKGIDLDMFDWREMATKYKEYIKQQTMEECLAD